MKLCYLLLLALIGPLPALASEKNGVNVSAQLPPINDQRDPSHTVNKLIVYIQEYGIDWAKTNINVKISDDLSYMIQEDIGKGSIGNIKRLVVDDKKTGKLDLAVKIVRQEQVDDGLRSEYTIGRALNGDSRFVGHYGLMEYQDSLFLFLEKADSDLSKHLAGRNKKDDIKTLLQMVADLNSKGIVHGDLHSDNVFLKNGRLVLGDFGLSWVYRPLSDEAQAYLASGKITQSEIDDSIKEAIARDRKGLAGIIIEMIEEKDHIFESEEIVNWLKDEKNKKKPFYEIVKDLMNGAQDFAAIIRDF